MVAAQEAKAAKIGVDILRRGGNAIDAAVATGLALAVTLPRAGNLGGGGFMLVYLAKERKTIVIDYREAAPADTPRDVFLNAEGEAVASRSRDSGLAVGVPGTVAGLSLALRNYGSGKFSLAKLAAPAVALARSGIDVEDDLADSLPNVQSRLKRWPSSARIFLHPDGSALIAWRQARSIRSGRRVGSHRARWRARLLRRAGGGENRRQRPRGGRPDDAGRSQILPRHRTGARAWHLSRL